jgi:dTDP-4-dehydrorhamnose 3,5-epimerase-like enzyme
MQILETALPEAKVLVPRRIGDVQGFFPRDGMRAILPAPASMPAFVQDNHVRKSAEGDVARAALPYAAGGVG